MAKKLQTVKSELLSTADALLVRIAETESLINEDIARMDREVEAVRAKHLGWEVNMEILLNDLQKKLVKLMRGNKNVIFEDEQRVDLRHGALLHTIDERVRKIKKHLMLENLKRQGFTAAIRIAESVDWDEVEKWPDEKLALVGTEKKRTENYTWEILNPEVRGRKSEVGKDLERDKNAGD